MNLMLPWPVAGSDSGGVGVQHTSQEPLPGMLLGSAWPLYVSHCFFTCV